MFWPGRDRGGHSSDDYGDDYLDDDDDDIYIMMHCVSLKMSTSSWESPFTTHNPYAQCTTPG